MSYDYNGAKEIYENGFIDFSFAEFMAFAKYSIHEMGKSIPVTEKDLVIRLKENSFNTIKNADSIHNACLWAKHPLNKETVVKITNFEIEKIKEVKEDYRKILFCALFLSKKDGNSDYYNRDIQDSINLSGVRFIDKEKNEFLYFLRNWIPMILGRSSRKILFSGDDEKGIFIEIDKKDNPMPHFPRYCKSCSIILKNKRKHGMCDDCYSEYCRVNQAKYDKKYKKY
jgi:hypothetical protein